MLLSIFLKIKSALISVIVFFSSVLTVGTPQLRVEMPDPVGGEYGRFVNPFIGTGGYPWCSGNTFPGAVYPFGAVKLSPDTCLATGSNLFGRGTSGYYYGDSYTLGFSHTRFSGAGVSDMGHFRVTPALGECDPTKRLRHPLVFSHKNETATAGYYAVYLNAASCMAELTATQHAGVERYTFDSEKDAHIFIDSTSFLKDKSATEGRINVNPLTGEISGEARVFTSFTSRYGGLKAYFVAEFNRAFESFATWSGDQCVQGREYAEGNDCGVDLNFGNISGQPLELKLAISFVSVDNARENLRVETAGLDFDDVSLKAFQAWDSRLSKIKISTDDDEIKTNFYTALYHSMIMPTDYTDSNGQFLGFDGRINTAQGHTYRSDMSLWDTFRTTHPLYVLIAPEIQTDCLNSLVEMAKAGGVLPRWPSGNGYTSCMIGTPADMVIAESYLKGVTDFDVEAAYAAMKLTSDSAVEYGPHRNGIDSYNTLGYVPYGEVTKSVSQTLEYAWADNSISLLASALGKTQETEHYAQKAQNYRNVFDSKTGYFRGRNADGSRYSPFSPAMTSFYDEVLPVKFSEAYCEGGAKHWRWAVPYDANGLIELIGGREKFVSELERFMKGATVRKGAINPGANYWIGNEHDLHAAYLFADAGRSDLTQKWVRWTLSERFSNDSVGLDGNDDAGALSSWYVWSSMGIYPLGGTDEYWIGSPNLERAEIDLGAGKKLVVTAHNQSEKNIYVQSVELNGVEIDTPRITHDMIKDGGALNFVMGCRPAQK